MLDAVTRPERITMVGVPTESVKLVPYGTFNGTQDVSFGLWVNLGLGIVPTQAQLDSYCAALGGNFDGFVDTSTVAAWYNALMVWQGLRAYYYAPNTVHAALVSEFVFATPRNGAGTANHPPMTAIVASLRTAVPGRSGRGRFYLPANGIGLQPGGTANGSDVDSLGSAIAGLIGEINAQDIPGGSAPGTVSVMIFTKGDFNFVTRVIIDNKPDSQRRRDDKLAPTHEYVGAV